jgi:hypothetical protein
MARLVEAKKRREGLEAKKKEDEEQAARQAESLEKAMKKANLIAAAEQVRLRVVWPTGGRESDGASRPIKKVCIVGIVVF